MSVSNNARLSPTAERRVREFGHHFLALAIVDGAAVVRVDKAQIPQLATLIDVGNPRRRELQDSLRETVLDAKPRDPLHERKKAREEAIALGTQRLPGEGAHGLLILGVRRRPARTPLCLAQRLLQRGLDPRLVGIVRRGVQAVQQIDRPGADQHLIEHVFVVAVRRRTTFDVAQSARARGGSRRRPGARHSSGHSESTASLALASSPRLVS